MSKVKSLVAAALTLATVGTAVHADVFTLTGSIDTSTYYNPTTGDAVAYSTNPGHPVVAAVNIYFQISALGAGEQGFGSGLTDIALTGGLTPYTGFGADFTHDTYGDDATVQYKASTKSTATNSVFATDADQGPSASDLKAITFYLANPPYTGASTTNGPDPRLTLGQTTPVLIGQAYVLWDGVTTSTLGFANTQFSTFNVGSTQFNTAQNAVEPFVVPFVGGVATPEPASLGILALGGLALLNRRRKA